MRELEYSNRESVNHPALNTIKVIKKLDEDRSNPAAV